MQQTPARQNPHPKQSENSLNVDRIALAPPFGKGAPPSPTHRNINPEIMNTLVRSAVALVVLWLTPEAHALAARVPPPRASATIAAQRLHSTLPIRDQLSAARANSHAITDKLGEAIGLPSTRSSSPLPVVSLMAPVRLLGLALVRIGTLSSPQPSSAVVAARRLAPHTRSGYMPSADRTAPPTGVPKNVVQRTKLDKIQKASADKWMEQYSRTRELSIATSVTGVAAKASQQRVQEPIRLAGDAAIAAAARAPAVPPPPPIVPVAPVAAPRAAPAMASMPSQSLLEEGLAGEARAERKAREVELFLDGFRASRLPRK